VSRRAKLQRDFAIALCRWRSSPAEGVSEAEIAESRRALAEAAAAAMRKRGLTEAEIAEALAWADEGEALVSDLDAAEARRFPAADRAVAREMRRLRFADADIKRAIGYVPEEP